ncbi:MAG TPA: hypothetical protein VK011_05280 [Acidimicrobiia bacterium]|nr:hypothetical protein [Acidimicrobiia bacterium]
MSTCPSSAPGPFRFVSLAWIVGLVAACAMGGDQMAVEVVPASVALDIPERPTPPTTPPTTTPPPTSTSAAVAAVSNRAAPLPLAVLEVPGAVWNGRIVVAGGLFEGGGESDVTYFYDPATDSWEFGPKLPTGIHHTTLGVLGDRLYLVGGYEAGDFGRSPVSAVWSLGPDDDEWAPEPELDTARGALALASTGDRLIAIGGVGPDWEQLATTEILEVGAPAWAPGPDLLEAREHHAAVAVGERVYAIGGRLATLDTNKATVEVLDGDTWQEAPPLNHARGGIAATVVDDMPCVAGGEEPDRTIGSIECLIGDAWELVAEMEVPRHGVAFAYLDGAFRVIAGGPLPNYSASTVHEVIPLER